MACVAGLSIALTVSSCILATMSRGVFFGTNAPTQKSKSESGTPASIVVGTSGSADARFELDTASARSLPSPINGSAGGDRAEIHIDAAGHHFGQRLRRALERHEWPSNPAARRKRSIVRCGGVPMPAAA